MGISIASLSLNSSFDAVIYLVVDKYKYILHTAVFWLSEEPPENAFMCSRLYLLFQVVIFFYCIFCIGKQIS